MEYVQMTLDDWLSMKDSLKKELVGVQQSFVKIGYMLRKIKDEKLYEQDGYKTIAEFAEKEYALKSSAVSRFIAINEKYSIDGYSDQLKPEYAQLGVSKLSEMLTLPESDMQMITQDTTREQIRELKQFNKEPVKGVADTRTELVTSFWKDNKHLISEAENATEESIKDIVNPSGSRTYKKGLYFLTFTDSGIKVKKFGENPENMSYAEFLERSKEGIEDAKAEINAEKAEMEQRMESIQEEKDADTSGGNDNQPSDAQRNDNEGQEIDDSDCDNGSSSADADRTGDSEDTDEEPGHAEDTVYTGTGDETEQEEETADTEEEENEVDDKREDTARPDIRKVDYRETADSGEGSCEQTDTGEDESAEDTRDSGQDEKVEIAPAQFSAETLEKTEEKDTEFMPSPEPIVEEKHCTRKDYLDTLTEYGMAVYLHKQYIRQKLTGGMLAYPEKLEAWLKTEVDTDGNNIEEEDNAGLDQIDR